MKAQRTSEIPKAIQLKTSKFLDSHQAIKKILRSKHPRKVNLQVAKTQ